MLFRLTAFYIVTFIYLVSTYFWVPAVFFYIFGYVWLVMSIEVKSKLERLPVGVKHDNVIIVGITFVKNNPEQLQN